ncbi:MAG: hypothetical protein LBT04_07890 [Prevotellaceae bacterium]|jgi:hypothetical protein|nr:hypothetical protein [Prevotellaceae bacterium]
MFYKIDTQCNNDVVGHYYPQLSTNYVNNYNPDSGKGIFRLIDDFGDFAIEFPDFTPNLSGFKLVRGAKLTDFISGTGLGNSLIMSNMAKNIFEKYTLCPHRFYHMPIHYKKEPQNYFMLHYLSNFSAYIDYEKSTFIEEDLIKKTRGNFIKINSLDDLLIKKKEVNKKYKGIGYYSAIGNEVTMNQEFSSMELDFFGILVADTGTYVSERLKNTIEENGLTGLDFFPAPHLSLSD